jgi:Xaa-Pro aminopeptidase
VKECELACAPDIVDFPRQIKDENEIFLIRRSCEIASAAFLGMLKAVKPGVKEKELALELEYLMKKAGAEDISFKSTVASGKRSSLPHGTASDKTIVSNDIITFDFGAKYKGYCSDITRTVFLGSCTKKQKEVYEIVLEAQITALNFISSGISCYEADSSARQIIKKKGYSKNFGHGLGHGVGLMIHERPRLSPLADKSDILQTGMTVTVEPGIYLEDEFGIRIEDTVLVTNNGVDVFTKPEKEIIIL